MDALIPTRNLPATSIADAGAHLALLLAHMAGIGVSCRSGWDVPGMTQQLELLVPHGLDPMSW